MSNYLLKYRLRSFTILEITVTMAIGAITITLAYISLNIVIRQYQEFKSNQERLTTLKMWNLRLKNETSNSTYILSSENGFDYVMKNETTINYIVTKENIIRKHKTSYDTLHLCINDYIKSYQAVVVKNPRKLVDRVLIEATLNDELLFLSFKKFYSSDELQHAENLKYLDLWQE